MLATVLRVLLAAALLGSLSLPAGHLKAHQGTDTGWTTFRSELPSAQVQAILVDQDGNLWIGTQTGLAFFDGRWEAFTGASGLPSADITALAQSPDGTLWIGTAAGLAKAAALSPGTEPRFAPLESISDSVAALWPAGTGELWVATSTGTGYVADGSWVPVDFAQGGDTTDIQAITGDSRGRIWLGGEGLYRYDPVSGLVQRDPSFKSSGIIDTLLGSPAMNGWPETLWVGTRTDGLWSYDQDQWSHFWRPDGEEYVEGIGANDVTALALDDEGVLWIGSASDEIGMSLFSRDGLGAFWGGGFWRTLSTSDRLAANTVSALAQDRQGTIWIGTDNGLTRFDGQSWRTLAAPLLPAGLDIISSLQDSAGTLWFGTRGFGLVHYAGNAVSHLTQSVDRLPDNHVTALVEDAEGYLWIGTERFGPIRSRTALQAMSDSQERLQWEGFLDAFPEAPAVTAGLLARDGSLWFGTANSGLLRYPPAFTGPPPVAASLGKRTADWTILDTRDGLADNHVHEGALLEDGEGRIWAGTASGLSRYDPAMATWTTYSVRNGMADSQVLSLAASPEAGLPVPFDQADLWAGTASGHIQFYDADTDTWNIFDQVGSPVRTLLLAPDLGLWAGSDNGLIRYDLATGLNHSYTQLDGLIGDKVRTLLATEDDTIWIGTNLGISRHRPLDESPKVAILTVNGKTPLDGHVQVLAGEPLAIAFRGGSIHVLPELLHYRMRLEGTDTEWRETSDRQVQYPGLQPGTFAFEVQAWDHALNLSVPGAKVLVDSLPTLALPMLGRVSVHQGYSIIGLGILATGGTAASLWLLLRTRRRRRQAIQRRYNPYISGEPIRANDMFFGRQELLAKIINTLHENSLMIHGERRIGKTSLLHQLAYRLREIEDPTYLFVPVFVDLEGTHQDEVFHLMMEEIVREIPAYGIPVPELQYDSLPGTNYNDRAFSRDLSNILESLQAATTKQVRLVLLMDEMDVINDFDPLVQQQMRRVFMRTFARSLGAVVAGIEISKEWDRVESPWFNLFNDLELGPLDEADARRLILEPVEGIYTYAPDAVDFIVAHSQGRPYYIQQHAMEAVNKMLADGRSQVTLDDVKEALDQILSARTTQ